MNMLTKRQYPRWQIDCIVDAYHVSASEDTIAEDIRGRCKEWPSDQRRLAVRDARGRHRQNVCLYRAVMRGNI